MKIGVSSYSYIRLTRAGEMTLKETIAKAKEQGFDVIEILGLSSQAPDCSDPEKLAEELREEAARCDIEIAAYTVAADLLRGCDGNFEKEVARIQREIDLAAIMGAPCVRHDASAGFPPEHVGPKSFDAALPRLAEGCRILTEYAAAKGIKTTVENHGRFCQDSRRVEKLVTAVNHPNFGVLIDIGNFICVDEDPRVAVGRLIPYAFHCHAKDFHLKPGTLPYPGKPWGVTRGGNYYRGAIIGHGDVPLLPCLRVMKRAGYSGVLSIEFEGMEDVLTALELGQANLRQLVEMA
ncbi:MAG: sugar phosphate isomerase/epimerase [Armatimonadetes bacterium]|nr:sugar phosphate isomerase/epimerase [Armatimonadota bacterium]